MCICVAADREGRIIARCVNRAKPSADDIIEVLGARDGESGVFLCDGATAYNKLVESKKCEWIVLKSREEYGQDFQAYYLMCMKGKKR